MIKYARFLQVLILLACFQSKAQKNYLDYHAKVIACEQLIAEEQFTKALEGLDSLFNQYEFTFLREIKLAAELSAHTEDYESSLKFVQLGIQSGWSIKSIKKSKTLAPLQDHQGWSKIESGNDSLHQIFLSRLNIPLRTQVHKMIKKDQKMALGVLLRITQKAQDKYAKNKFAPHSEQQLQLLDSILTHHGYPGEQLIGNRVWTSVILSHHNSISLSYNSKDTLYDQLRPKLLAALRRGELSPYELAQVDDWRAAALTGHDSTSVGFIGEILKESDFKIANENRSAIGLRSIELRNKLIDIEDSSGLNLYLPKGWQKGKIMIDDHK